MKLGIVGKPNVGKSTFFSAITSSEVKVADYPFTTVEPNAAVGYVTVECPCSGMDVECDSNTRCVEGRRFVPVNFLDIAGLVPGASEGRGMGNEFLDSVREADLLIHVIDASGRTDERGESTEGYDPSRDVEFVEREFDEWMYSLVEGRWDSIMKKMRSGEEKFADLLAERLSGLGISRGDVSRSMDPDYGEVREWGEEELRDFVEGLRERAKPSIYACNKMDVEGAGENFESLGERFPEREFVPVSAQAELTLQKAVEKGVVEYVPGDPSFDIIGNVSERQERGLRDIEELMDRYGGTGVQEVLGRALFEILGVIVVYPVEDVSNLSDQHGNVLPDALLLPEGATPVDLAHEIHSNIGEGYSKAVDARSGRAIGKDTPLEDGQIVKIEAR